MRAALAILVAALMLAAPLVVAYEPHGHDILLDPLLWSSDLDDPQPLAPPPGPTPDAYTYRDYDSVLNELLNLAATYPSITSLIDIGDSWEKIDGTADRDIMALKVSDNVDVDEDEPEVLYMAMHHAREWPAVEVVMEFLTTLLAGYGTDPQATWTIDNRELWFIPAVNPDGYQYSRDIDDMWRKNRNADVGSGCVGVDPNRNYAFGWGVDGASSGNPCDETYIGPAPFSEPEQQAIKAFTESHNFTVSLSYHTYSGLMLYPWGYTTSPAPEQDALRNLAIELVADSGYAPMQASTLYTARGDSDDWLYDELGIFAYTPELGFWEGSDAESFHPSDELVVQGIIDDNMNANWLIAYVADNPYMTDPTITHTPLQDTPDRGGPYRVSADVTWDGPVGSVNLSWQVDGSGYLEMAMDLDATGSYVADIPGAPGGSVVDYHIRAVDGNGNDTASPQYAPPDAHSFSILNVTIDYGVGELFVNGTAVGTVPFASRAYNHGSDTWSDPVTGLLVERFDGMIPVEIENTSFETNDPAWTVTGGLWARGGTTGPGAPGEYDGSSVWGTNLGGKHQNNNDATLSSPPYPIPADAVDPVVSWWQHVDIETDYDWGRFEVTTSNGTEIVDRFTGEYTSGPMWEQVNVSLAAYKGTSPVFDFHFLSDGGLTENGWYIDSLTVSYQLENWTVVATPAAIPGPANLSGGASYPVAWDVNLVDTGLHRATVQVMAADGYPQDDRWVEPFTLDAESPPVADAGTDQAVLPGTLVTFDGSGSTDNDAIVEWTWTFMDGTPKVLTGVNPTYTFLTAGDYQVTLIVNDTAGLTEMDVMWVNVSAFTIPVGLGWNLFSLATTVSGDPVTVLDDALGDGLTSWDLISTYDAASGAWQTTNPSRPAFMNDLTWVDNTMGLWLRVVGAGDGQLAVAGIDPGPMSIPMVPGWNLVGFPSLTEGETVGSALSSITYSRIEIAGSNPPMDFVTLAASAPMGPGGAYWIHSGASQVWTVP